MQIKKSLRISTGAAPIVYTFTYIVNWNFKIEEQLNLALVGLSIGSIILRLSLATVCMLIVFIAQRRTRG